MIYLVRHLGRAVNFLFVILCVTMWSGCETTAPATKDHNASVGTTPAEVIYRFQVGDLVTIAFSGNTSAPQAFEGRVKDDGTITLLYVGTVKAVGKTEGELQADIHEAYVPKYFQTLGVTVKGEERFFFVDGDVKQPGRINYAGSGMTVLKAIAAAGGFTDFARKSKVRLTRGHDGKKFTVDCIKAQEKPELDLPVYPGDQVFVPRRLF